MKEIRFFITLLSIPKYSHIFLMKEKCENIDQLLDGCQLILISNERRNGEIHIHTII